MKIYSPNRDYTGVSVPFCNGVGETNDPHLIQWFKDHGYKVEESEAAPIEETLAAEIPTEEAPTEEAPAETKPAGKKGKA